MLAWIKSIATKTIALFIWPILLWRSNIRIKKGRLIFEGFLTAIVPFLSCLFMKPSIMRTIILLSGGLLFYRGYCIKRRIMGETG